MKRFLSIPTAILLLAVGTWHCGKIGKKKDLPGPNDKIYTVSMASVSARDIPDVFEMKGVFTPPQRVDIKSDFSGKVQALSVVEGQVVATGDALLKIEDEKLPYVIDRQRAELKEAEAQLEIDSNKSASGQAVEEALEESPPEEGNIVPNIPAPTQPLASPGAVVEPAPEGGEAAGVQPEAGEGPEEIASPLRRSLAQRNRLPRRFPVPNMAPQAPKENPELAENRVNLGQARVDRIKAEIALTEKQLAGSTILSPFDGFISKVAIAEGSTVHPGDLLMQIVDFDPIELTLQIPKDQIDKIDKNMEFKILVPDVAMDNLQGEISFIGAEVDPAKKTVEVRIRLANPGLRIKIGMEGSAQLAVATHFHPALLIPTAAMIIKDNKKYVYVIRGQMAELEEIETGGMFEGMVEVKSGIKKTDRVVTQGVNQLKEDEEFIKIQ